MYDDFQLHGTVKTDMKSKTAETVAELVLPIIEGIGGFLVEVNLRGERGGKILEVFVDTDGGISADNLTTVSRSLSEELDRLDIIPGKYRLEVSSPGLGRPLKLPRQYAKNMGRNLDVTYQTPDGEAKMEGILQTANATTITLTDKKKVSVSIDIANIVEAVVVPSMKTSDR